MPACTGNPFNADPVADFQMRGLSSRTELDYFTDTLVATYLACWSGVWE